MTRRGTSGPGWRPRGLSEADSEFGERGPDSVMRRHADGEFVVFATQVLHNACPEATVRAEASRLSPRIGRSLALSRA